jgi:glutathione S-transferase
MELSFAPLSCSLATRIAIYEAGLDAGFHQVVLSTKQTTDVADYLKINPKGQMPALPTAAGSLTEDPAVLQDAAVMAELHRDGDSQGRVLFALQSGGAGLRQAVRA